MASKQQARSRRQGAAAQAPERGRIPGDSGGRKRVGRVPYPGRSLFRLARLAAAPGKHAEKWCHKNGHRGELCSEYQIQGVLDAHSWHQPRRDDFSVIRAGSLRLIDAIANYRHVAAFFDISSKVMMDIADPAPATTPAKAATRAGPARRRRARLLSGRRLSGAVSLRISSRTGSPAFRSAPSMPRSSPAIRRNGACARLKEFWELVSSPVPWNPVVTERPWAQRFQRGQRRPGRDLRRARLLYAAVSAGAAVAAGQSAVAELLRHRAASRDAGASGGFRPDQRSARPASASAR